MRKGSGMATSAMVDAYVRQLLVEEFGEDLEVREDGRYEIPPGRGIRIWVVDGNHRTRRLLLTARILTGADDSPELLSALNDLNALTPYGRYFLTGDGEVFVEDTLLAEDLEPGSLFASIGFVAWAAETHGAHLLERSGRDEEAPTVGPNASDAAVTERVAPLTATATADPSTSAGGRVVSANGYL